MGTINSAPVESPKGQANTFPWPLQCCVSLSSHAGDLGGHGQPQEALVRETEILRINWLLTSFFPLSTDRVTELRYRYRAIAPSYIWESGWLQLCMHICVLACPLVHFCPSPSKTVLQYECCRGWGQAVIFFCEPCFIFKCLKANPLSCIVS